MRLWRSSRSASGSGSTLCPGRTSSPTSLSRLTSSRPRIIRSWPEPWRWSTILACLFGAVANYFGVDCTAHTVHQLGIDLGRHITVIHRSFIQVSDSCRLDNIANNIFLDALVLGNTTGTVCAPYVPHMASTMLRPSTVSSLLCHDIQQGPRGLPYSARADGDVKGHPMCPAYNF